MQLDLPWLDDDALRREMEARLGQPIRLVLTDNGSTMMSFQRDRYGAAVCLRLHRMFLCASPSVLNALAAWVKHPRRGKDGALLGAFVRSHEHLVRRRIRVHTMSAHGDHYDLAAVFRELNGRYFGGALTARIVWGRRPGRGRRRSIRFGSYTSSANLIRIHPFLDQAWVPDYFVRYIVFHEMLHAHLGISDSANGRRRVHTAEFRRLERAYQDYERATAWEKNRSNLRKLFR